MRARGATSDGCGRVWGCSGQVRYITDLRTAGLAIYTTMASTTVVPQVADVVFRSVRRLFPPRMDVDGWCEQYLVHARPQRLQEKIVK